MNTPYTYTTIAIPGSHSASKIKAIMSKLGQAFAVVSTRQNPLPAKASVTRELPHAFSEFDVSVPCANDSVWDEKALEAKKDCRLDLDGIRNLRLESRNNHEEVED